MMINMILARSVNGVIGLNNKLPWHLPEDLKRFKDLTKGDAVIMGRKTWESLPAKFRPLPDRVNIVITSAEVDTDTMLTYRGAIVVNSLRGAIAMAKGSENVWIIGGESVYRQAIHIADRAYVTEINDEYLGDTFSPQFASDKWLYTLEGHYISKTGLRYSYILYENKFPCDL